MLFARAASRDDLAAVAAFNLELARAASELSESMLGLIRLQWWREAVEELQAGGAARRQPVVEALSAAARRHRLPTERLLAMIAGREEELESAAPPSRAQFEVRADATSANLIRLWLAIEGLDPGDPPLAAASREIGRAYATVGCARSVLLDARRRKVRLPADVLSEAAVDLDKLFDLRPQPALQACLNMIADQAAADLAAARRRPLPRRARPIALLAKLAALHLERLRRARYDPFDPGVLAAPPMDVWRLLGTAITGRF